MRLENPYVGPKPFRRGQDLYGRDDEAGALSEMLLAKRIAFLFSPSGAGKTSLLETLVSKRMEGEGFAILPSVRVNRSVGASLKGARNPFLASAVLSLLEGSSQRVAKGSLLPTLADALDAVEGTLPALPAATLTTPPPQDAPRLTLLILDQLEELFTSGHPDRTTEALWEEFLGDVGTALRKPHRYAVLAMREEFVGTLQSYAHAIPTCLANTFRLDLLRDWQAVQAIQQPAQSQGVTFDDDAVKRLVRDLSLVQLPSPSGIEEAPGLFIEPVHLQVVCLQLWQKLETRLAQEATPRIRLADVETSAGSVDHALEGYYNGVVLRIAQSRSVEERAIRDWFDSVLISLDGVRQPTQNPPELSGKPNNPNTRAGVVEDLDKAFLVRREIRRGTIWWELAHDRLIKPVRASNASWKAERLSAFQKRAEEWLRAGRSDELILDGRDLEAAERWAATAPRLSPAENDLLNRSRIDRRRRAVQRHGWWFAAVVSALGLAAVTSLFLRGALKQTTAAKELLSLKTRVGETLEAAALRVRRSREMGLPFSAALRSRQALEAGGHELAALLAVQAFRFSQREHRADEPSAQLYERPIEGGAVYQVLRDPLRLPGGYFSLELRVPLPVASAGIAPDGEVVALDGERKLRLWQASASALAPRLLDWTGSADLGMAAVAACGAGRFVIGARDGVHRLTMSKGGTVERIISLADSGSDVRFVACSDDAARVLAIDGQDVMSDWSGNATNPTKQSGVQFAAVSRDGKKVAAWFKDSPARYRLWTDLGARTIAADGLPCGIDAMAFTADGRWLVAGAVSAGREKRCREAIQEADDATAAGGTEEAPVEGPAAERGKWSLVAWDLDAPDRVPRVAGISDRIYSLTSFAAGNRILLLAGTRYGEIQLSELPRAKDLVATRLGALHRGRVTYLGVSREGRYLVSRSPEEGLRLWRMAGDACDKLQAGANDDIVSLAFVARGTLAVGVRKQHEEGLVRLLPDASKRFETETCSATENVEDVPLARVSSAIRPEWTYPRVLAFEPRGSLLAVGAPDSAIRVWNGSQRGPVSPHWLERHPGAEGVFGIQFGEEGGRGCLISLWGKRHKPPQSVQSGQVGEIQILADAAAVQGDSHPVLQTLRAADEVVEGKLHTYPLKSLALSSDGAHLVAGSPESPTVHVWNSSGKGSCEFVQEGYSLPSSTDLAGERGIMRLSFASKGWLVAGGVRGSIFVWRSLGQSPVTLRSGEGKVVALALNKDGTLLATAHQHGVVLLWDLGELERLTANPAASPQFGIRPIALTRAHTDAQGHAGDISAIAYGPDDLLFTGAEDGTIRRWENTTALVERLCRAVSRNLSRQEWDAEVGADVTYEPTCPKLPKGEGVN